MRKTSGVAAVAVIGTALVLAAGPALAAGRAAGPAGGGAWRIIRQLPPNKRVQFAEVSALTAAGSSGAWAFDSSVPEEFMMPPTAWERHGTAWTRMSFPGRDDEIVAAAGASSASNVWAFTNDIGNSSSRALRWNGSSWSVTGTFPATLIDAAVVLSRSNVWVFTDRQTLHWNGSSWSPTSGGSGLTGGSGVSSGSMWAVGADGTDVAHWTGQAWVRTSLAGLLPARRGQAGTISGIYVQSGNSVYAICAVYGQVTVLHYNGAAWSKAAQLSTARWVTSDGQITGDGRGGFWEPVGASPSLLHYSDGRLTAAALPHPAEDYVDAVSLIPGTSEILAGGSSTPLGDTFRFSSAVILRYTP